jgi:membrane-bound ClpP family serine protease
MQRSPKVIALCFAMLALGFLVNIAKAEEKAIPSNLAVTPTAPPEAPTYLLVSVKGTIGRDFTAATMKAYLDSAEGLKPAVVLEMDTGGGDIHDAEEIIDLMISHKGLRFVALVRRSLSAGAAITLACKEIYVTETATIGGAVSYSLGRDGLPAQMPADVAEKFQSI